MDLAVLGKFGGLAAFAIGGMMMVAGPFILQLPGIPIGETVRNLRWIVGIAFTLGLLGVGAWILSATGLLAA